MVEAIVHLPAGEQGGDGEEEGEERQGGVGEEEGEHQGMEDTC